MTQETPAGPLTARPLFGAKARAVVLVCVFLAAFAVRLGNLRQPLLEFHPNRQLYMALIARSFYLESAPGIPQWRRDVSAEQMKVMDLNEPWVLPRLAALGYRVIGGEAAWFPRLLSVLFWMAGGLILYRVARRIADPDAAVFAAAFFLLSPFPIVASRSFQPDPLMIFLCIAGMWATVRYYDAPSRARLLLAAALCGMAVFIKPQGVFTAVAPFIALAVWKKGLRKGILSLDLLTFLVVAVGPGTAYVACQMLAPQRAGALPTFLVSPGFLLRPVYWSRWLYQINTVVGVAAAAGAIVGVPLARKGLPRALLAGCLLGYLAFALTVSYGVCVHDYYSLQLVPVVALSVGLVCSRLIGLALQAGPRLIWRAAVWGAVLLAVPLSMPTVYRDIYHHREDHERELATAETVGKRVNHSTRTIILGGGGGLAAWYYGEVAGSGWPDRMVMEFVAYRGGKSPSAAERLRETLAAAPADYFIITDLVEFSKQPELKQLLFKEYPVFAQGDDFLIFDLREKRTE